MLGNLLLVFREVLEAALIISIVAAATRGVPSRGLWIGAGITLGLVGAAVVAAFAGVIGDSMSGMGQEWFNAGVLLAAVVMISWHVVWMARHSRELSMQMKAVGTAVSQGSRPMTALLVVIALAVLREGSEVVLFGYGLMASGASMASLVGGGLIGLALGVATGLALYFGLLKIPVRHFFSATNALLVLLAAGLASSAAGKLVQADVLPTLVDQLWDSSWLLTDESVVGNMMHVLVGYTAQPSGMQMVFYAATVVLLVIGMRLSAAPAPAKPAQSPAPRALA
jgi:high-affinity iron transporter